MLDHLNIVEKIIAIPMLLGILAAAGATIAAMVVGLPLILLGALVGVDVEKATVFGYEVLTWVLGGGAIVGVVHIILAEGRAWLRSFRRNGTPARDHNNRAREILEKIISVPLIIGGAAAAGAIIAMVTIGVVVGLGSHFLGVNLSDDVLYGIMGVGAVVGVTSVLWITRREWIRAFKRTPRGTRS